MQKTLFFTVFVVIAIVACKHKAKDPCSDIFCDPPAFAPPLRFVVKDKVSGEDLFFSAQPKYKFSDIQMYSPGAAYNGFTVDTFHTPHTFLTAVGKTGHDTLVLKISNTGPDTLRYDADVFSIGCCGRGAKLSDFFFDGQPLNISAFNTGFQPGDSTIVTIYK